MQYRAQLRHDPLEAGSGALLDLDGARFIGREALLAERGAGSAPAHGRPRRSTGEPVPVDGGVLAGVDADGTDGRRGALGGVVVRARAQHRDRAAWMRRSATTTPVVRAPDGDRGARVHPIPFVT